MIAYSKSGCVEPLTNLYGLFTEESCSKQFLYTERTRETENTLPSDSLIEKSIPNQLEIISFFKHFVSFRKLICPKRNYFLRITSLIAKRQTPFLSRMISGLTSPITIRTQWKSSVCSSERYYECEIVVVGNLHHPQAITKKYE